MNNEKRTQMATTKEDNAKKVTYKYEDIEEIVCVRRQGTNKAGQPYKVLQGRTKAGKYITVVPQGAEVIRIIVTERTETK